MKLFALIILVIIIGSTTNLIYGKVESPGKKLFYNAKGKYGSCNYCHKSGESAGRWDFEYEELSREEGRKIPSLKGLGKKKTIEQIERSIVYMKNLFGFELTEEEISQIAEYITTL